MYILNTKIAHFEEKHVLDEEYGGLKNLVIISERFASEKEFIDLKSLKKLSYEDQYDKLIEYFSETSKHHENITATYRMAEVLIGLNKVDEAKEWFNRACRIENPFTNYPDENAGENKLLCLLRLKLIDAQIENGIKPQADY